MSERHVKSPTGQQSKAVAGKAGRTRVAAPAMYRGVRLAVLTHPSRFSQEQIEKAVDAAIAANPDVFNSRK